MKNKNLAAIWAILLGTIGAHRFYLGQTGRAIGNIFLCSTGLPTVLGIIAGFRFLLMSNEDFDKKYNSQAIQKDILEAIKNNK
tara:strand:- start:531 stop:779 length:249 start_codon:yes stop_codon:yes gene_type:complete